MAKRGRKMVMGIRREPNGRASRSERVAHIQRELEMMRAGILDPRWGTPIGTLCRKGDITVSQMEAGEWFSEARSAADAALGLPPRSCTAQDMNRLAGRSNREDGPDEVRAKQKAIDAYDRAVDFLGQGSKRLAAMEWVCVYERRHDDHAQLLALVDGLDALIRFRSMRRAA